MSRETRLLMICPTSDVTPEMLARTIHAMGEPVGLKETCYGCLVEGEADVVRRVPDKVRDMEPYAIFSKRRAYRMGDPVRCRAQHGTRPGYSQLEEEWSKLPFIRAGLIAAEKGEAPPERPKREKLPVLKFKEICEVKE